MKNCAVAFAILANIFINIKADCNYFGSIYVTCCTYKNKSLSDSDILILKVDTGECDYLLQLGDETVTVPKQVKDCDCQINPCIQFCCTPDMALIEGICEHSNKIGNEVNINKTLINRKVAKDSLKCKCFIEKHPELYNGSDDKLISRWREYAHAISVFFIILIIIIYQLLPNFKSFHGKCCTCYFVCLAVTYTQVIIARLIGNKPIDKGICKLLGYSGYFSFMATFLWLSIITYNLWRTFQNIGVSRNSRYKLYHIFVWSVATLLLFITYLVVYFSSDEKLAWVPAVGIHVCWIETNDWSAMIYYYGPMLVLLTCNLTLFISTANRIFVENRKNRRQLKKSESQQNIKNFANFFVFLRLFAIVGVLWILEVMSYIIGLFNQKSIWITILDIPCSVHGIILFMGTVFKKDVFESLLRRCRGKRSQLDISRTSNTPKVPASVTDQLP